MAKFNDPEQFAADLRSAEGLVDRIVAAETAKADAERAKQAAETELASAKERITSLEAEIQTVTADRTALDNKVTELEAKVAEFEQASTESDSKAEELAQAVQTAQDLAGEIETMKATLAEKDAAIEGFTAKIAELEAAKTEAEKTAEQAAEEVAEISEQAELVQKTLGVQGQDAVETVTEPEGESKRENAELVARYERLSHSPNSRDRVAARKLLAEHREVIVAHLDEKTGTQSAEAAKRDSGISEAEMEQFNAWLAKRARVNDPVAKLPYAERNALAAEVRRELAQNKDLYDRCFAARQ